jgi:hypothetical protein
MIQLVSDYLIQNRSFSIPGIGTIYVERTPAQSDFVNRQLLPPSYHYRFDKYSDAPARDFFLFLSKRKQVEEYEAIRQYNEWAQQFREAIGNEEGSALEGIGILKRDNSGEIKFEALASPRSFDVPVAAERVIRSNVSHHMLVGDKETTSVAMSDLLHDEGKAKKTSWWIYLVIIAVILGIAAMIYIYYMNGVAASS